MRVIDLRSDTVTQPTPAMRDAMKQAEVGDDVYGEDPTVKRLEATAAERMGKEAGLFVVSGTMGNFVSVLTHARPGEAIIVGSESHIVHHEAWSAEGLGNIRLVQVENDARGGIDPRAVRAAIDANGREGNGRVAAVCLENSHNRCGGAAISASATSAVAAVAHAAGLPLHLDGARIFNAALALETTPAVLAAEADSVTFCLSKGLSAPIGSVVCGSADFIRRARRSRSMLGGQMREVGVIAAAGIVALEQMVDRLADDHANARLLAQGMATVPGIRIDPSTVDTNIVIFDVEGFEPAAFRESCKERGVLVTGVPPHIRMVTHYGIERDDIEETLERVREAVASLS
jgi:threonine aldolase